jgi:WD40 repeat protein
MLYRRVSLIALLAASVAMVGCPPVADNVIVPNVCGMTQSAATSTVTGAQLVVGNVTTALSQTVPAGRVISQNPPAGTGVAPNTAIALVISTGGIPEIAWSQVLSPDSIIGLSIDLTDNGGYVIGGGYDGRYSMYALKLSSLAHEDWSVVYSEDTEGAPESWRSEAASVKQTADGGYMMLGAKDYNLLKLDENGDIEWTKNFFPANPYSVGHDCASSYSEALVICGDGGYFAAGSSYVGLYVLASVVKTDANGNVEFCKVINDNNRDYEEVITEAKQTADGGFILTGYSENGYEHGYLALLIKLDSAGNLEWSKTYQYPAENHGADAYTVAQTADGGYILGGDLWNWIDAKALGFGCWIARVDADGDIIWSRSYDNQTIAAPRAIEMTPDGDFVACGHKGTEMTVSKFNSSGEILWNYPLDGFNQVGNDLRLTPDGGCVVVGSGTDGTALVKVSHVYVP